MKRNPVGLLSIVGLLCLSGCGANENQKLYGDKITRSEATTILSSIVNATTASGFTLPTAFSAEKTTLTLALIFVGARTDQITYDKTNQYYCDVCGGTTLWVYYQNSTMYELSSVTSTDSSSKQVITKTYKTTTSPFDDAIYDARTDIFIPTPRNIPQEAIIDQPKTLLDHFQAIEKDGKYTSGNITYSFKDEEYRSKGDGYLYLSYKEVPSDGSSASPCTYVFENNLLVKGYEQNGLFQPGGTYTWTAPSYEYPNLSEFTKR
jgi:hypothetical protein